MINICRSRIFVAIALFTLLAIGPSTVFAATYQQEYIGQQPDRPIPYYVYDSQQPGPTVLVVGGVHGNEFSGAVAAEQIRSWTVRRGRLIVLPCANIKGFRQKTRFIPGAPKADRDLNRNFPRRADPNDPPRGELAKQIWDLVKQIKPDWLIDLHEGTNTRAEHPQKPKGIGNTVIAHSKGEAVEVSKRISEALNKRYPDAKAPFISLEGSGDTYLASAVAVHLGAQTLIVETHRTKPPLSYRTRQHRLAVYELLRHLGMITEPADDTAFPLFAHVIRPEERSKKTVVGLYDAAGTSGRGVPSLTNMFAYHPDTVLVPIGPLDIKDDILKSLDVVIFPGGSGSKQGKAIGEEGRRAVRRFVKQGGGYIGICAGAYLATNRFSWGLKILDAKTVSPKWQRGAGMMDVEFTSIGQRLLKPKEKTLKIRYHNGPIIEPDGDDALPDYKVLGIFRTEVAKNGSPKGAMINSPAIVAARYGSGRVVCLSPHAEGSDNETIVAHALRWVTPKSLDRHQRGSLSFFIELRDQRFGDEVFTQYRPVLGQVE